MKRILSLGAGVQSTTVLLMSCKGLLPKLDAAVFADTGWEPPSVYEHLERLIPYAAECGIPVHTVSAQSQTGPRSIRDEALNLQVIGQSTKLGRWGSMPLFVNKKDHRGQINRQCTNEYKIEPKEKFIKQTLLGLPSGTRIRECLVEQWYGISSDEASRMRDSQDRWQRNVYPLCGWPEEYLPHTFSRRDCLEWLKDNWPHPVPRSACIGCPFHSDAEWDRMRKEDPASFVDAVDFDERIRDCGGMRGKVYLHSSLVPLSEVKFSDDRQLHLFDSDCSGVCGV
jgi:hypothetical protein